MLRVMLRLAEQNNSVTALFFIHFSKWTNVLLLAVINTINKTFTCRKICLTETATQSTDNSRLFSSGYKQTITPTRKNVRWCRTWRRLLVYNNGDFKLFSWNLQRFTLWRNVSLWFELDYYRILIKLCVYLPQLNEVMKKKCSKEELDTTEEGLS